MKWPNEDVSENGSLFPVGMLTVKVVNQRDGEAKNGQATIEVQTRIVKPANLKGQSYNFNFMIGVTAATAEKLGIETGEDLAAENEETWKGNPSARRYKTFIKKAGVPDTGDTEEEAEGVQGKLVGIYNENRDNKYNEAARFYTEAEAESQPATKPISMNGKVGTSKLPPKQTTKAATEPKADESWDA